MGVVKGILEWHKMKWMLTMIKNLNIVRGAMIKQSKTSPIHIFAHLVVVYRLIYAFRTIEGASSGMEEFLC